MPKSFQNKLVFILGKLFQLILTLQLSTKMSIIRKEKVYNICPKMNLRNIFEHICFFVSMTIFQNTNIFCIRNGPIYNNRLK